MTLVREQVVQTAEKYVSRGKIEPAIREYRKLLAENPNDINTLNRIGDLYARINRIDEAVDFFFQIADRYTAEGFFVKAIAIYKKIIKLDPTRLDVYEKLAELYHRQGLVNEARTQYQVLADYYVKHANATSAIAIYQKMSEVEPQNPTYHVRLAEIYREQHLLEKARSEYQIIAEMMLEHDRPQEAAQVYERALDLDASDLGFIEDAVRRLRGAGNEAGAARFLSVAVERNPAALAIARATPRMDLDSTATRRPDLDSTTSRRAALDSTASRKVALDSTASRQAEALDSTTSRQARRKPPEPSLREDKPPPREDRPKPAPAEERGDETMFMDAAELGLVAPRAADPSLADAMAAAAAAAGAEAEESRSAADSDEIELDLDGAFSLELEDDEEPASLVKPPPDLADQPRRPAWASPLPEPAATAPAAPSVSKPPESPVEQPSVTPDEVDLGEIDVTEDLGGFFELAPELPEFAPPEPADLEREERLEQMAGARAFAQELNLEFDPGADGLGGIDRDRLERTASALEPRPAERDEDLVSEAEVLAKYGLEEKAIERLREAIRVRPDHLAAYALIAQIQMDKGWRPKVVETANQMSKAAAAAGDREHWPRLRKALVAAGYRLEEDRVLLDGGAEPSLRKDEPSLRKDEPSLRKDEPSLHVDEPSLREEIPALLPSIEIEEIEVEEIEIEEIEVEVPLTEDAPPLREDGPTPFAVSLEDDEEEPETEILFVEDEVELDVASLPELELETPFLEAPILEDELPTPVAAPPVAAAPVVPVERPKVDTRHLFDDEADDFAPEPEEEILQLPDLAALEPVPAPAVAPQAPAAKAPPSSLPAAAAPSALPAVGRKKVASVDQMMAGLLGEKPAKRPRPLAAPPSPVAEVPQAAPVAAAPPPVSAPPAILAKPALFNPLEIGEMIEAEEIEWDQPADRQAAAEPQSLDDTGMSWLDEADRSRKSGDRKGVSDAFDDEDDFFDLAAELEEELSREELFKGGDGGLMPSEQSLEEIVEGFKKGVAEHLSATDYDTHFNLGIAYREMGLFDEAVGEFQLAAKDPGHLVLCCSMLGLCFLDKGMPDLAAKWYRTGLEAPGIPDDDHLGLMYDLGNALDTAGDRDGAYKVFVDLYGIDSNYRDVVTRVEELSPAG